MTTVLRTLYSLLCIENGYKLLQTRSFIGIDTVSTLQKEPPETYKPPRHLGTYAYPFSIDLSTQQPINLHHTLLPPRHMSNIHLVVSTYEQNVQTDAP